MGLTRPACYRRRQGSFLCCQCFAHPQFQPQAISDLLLHKPIPFSISWPISAFFIDCAELGNEWNGIHCKRQRGWQSTVGSEERPAGRTSVRCSNPVKLLVRFPRFRKGISSRGQGRNQSNRRCARTGILIHLLQSTLLSPRRVHPVPDSPRTMMYVSFVGKLHAEAPSSTALRQPELSLCRWVSRRWAT